MGEGGRSGSKGGIFYQELILEFLHNNSHTCTIVT